MNHPGKPELATNRAGETVAEALAGFITHAATGFVGGAHLDIATAYFNVGGYSLLADSLDQTTGVRLLLGAEPTPPEKRRRVLSAESVYPERAAAERLQRALTDHEQNLAIDRDLLGFSIEADAAAQRLVRWLRSESVSVRRLEGRFLHGKAFLVGDQSHGVVAGSSNFTFAGLTSNLELNLGNYSPYVVTQVQEWFDELWDEATDYDLAALFEARYEPHLPQLIYLRMLWERYGAELHREAREEGVSQIHLTSFQRDGLWRAGRILARYKGVLIADEVGLGKTYLTGELIREAAIENRQRVLVITPATLRDGPWRAFRSEYNLPMELVSFDELTADRRLNPRRASQIKLDARVNQYAMVVVDEAHNLRSPSTQRAEALRRLLAGSPPKLLVLLTATPVNNSLWDLYHQLGYFLRNDAAFADVGIKSLRDHFHRAMTLNPDDLSPEHLFDVLDTVAVRRTRSFVKRFYPNDTIVIQDRETTISFPTPRVRKITYDLDALMPGFFDHFERALDPPTGADFDDPEILTLARYVPSQYRLDEAHDAYETQLAGLLRSGLLKRFESSPHAFANTCERMAQTHDGFLSLLETGGRVASGEALVDWVATDSDDLNELEAYLDANTARTEPAARYDAERLARHVRQDRDLLSSFAAAARQLNRSNDPTLAELVSRLISIADQAQTEGIGPADTRDRRKVLIFSYYADTVEWIYRHLLTVTKHNPRLAPYRGRVAAMTGAQSTKEKTSILWGFAPATTDAPEGEDEDHYDIVVTTDVLAEGVNLQQARHIINYDLPWNPMRLVQRHGRIDRIGSHHAEVFLHCVFPDARLDDLLGLEERLNRKLSQAAASVGVGLVMPGQIAPPVDRDFTETRQEIDRLRQEDAGIFERGGTARGALSGEEYRQELRQALENSDLAAQIQRLPWGSGSGMSASTGQRPGFVFCVRVADSEQVLFRHVAFPCDNGHPPIVDETLVCLDMARPTEGFDTARTLDDHAYQRAFAAWEIARGDIVEKWNYMADKANLEPRIPKLLHRASEIVRSNSPSGLTQSDIDRAIDTIRAPYSIRTIRAFRNALTSSDNATEQAKAILGVIQDLGLQPQHPPEPLPEISDNDVHLVCWQAII